jgi:hypothetical protein
MAGTLPSAAVPSGSTSTAFRSHGAGPPISQLRIVLGSCSLGRLRGMYRTSGTRAVRSVFQK